VGRAPGSRRGSGHPARGHELERHHAVILSWYRYPVRSHLLQGLTFDLAQELRTARIADEAGPPHRYLLLGEQRLLGEGGATAPRPRIGAVGRHAEPGDAYRRQ